MCELTSHSKICMEMQGTNTVLRQNKMLADLRQQTSGLTMKLQESGQRGVSVMLEKKTSDRDRNYRK